MFGLAFADSEHFGAAIRASTLRRRLAVFHCDGLRIFHFPLGSAFHTICLHDSSFLLGICYQAYNSWYVRVKRETRLNPNISSVADDLNPISEFPGGYAQYYVNHDSHIKGIKERYYSPYKIRSIGCLDVVQSAIEKNKSECRTVEVVLYS
jgi:hypothetical protein